MKRMKTLAGALLGYALAVAVPGCDGPDATVREVGEDARATGIAAYRVGEIEGGTQVVLLGSDDEEIAAVTNRRVGEREVFRVEAGEHWVEASTAFDGSIEFREDGLEPGGEGESQMTEYGLTLLRMMMATQQDLGFGEHTIREVGDGDEDTTPYSQQVCTKVPVNIVCVWGFCFSIEVEVCYIPASS